MVYLYSNATFYTIFVMQTYQNHMKSEPRFMIWAPLIAISLIIWLVIAYKALSNDPVSLRLLISYFATNTLGLFLIVMCVRPYSQTVQDRIIRSEENFRHYRMTNKMLDDRLTLKQIIALRFASDAEFVELAQRAITENLSQKQIKESIKNRKSDTLRV